MAGAGRLSETEETRAEEDDLDAAIDYEIEQVRCTGHGAASNFICEVIRHKTN
jgi:hypothetical protein